MKGLSLLLVFCVGILSSTAQNECGHVFSHEDDLRLIRNIKKSKQATPRSATLNIPMQLHLVARTNGNNRIFEDLAFDAICELNIDLAQADVQVYLTEEINYIDDDLAYDHAINDNSANFFLSNQKVPNAINVFVIGNIDNNFAGYYNGQFDLIVMDKDFMGGGSPIFAHELGHYFSLAHTFNGWEGIVAEDFARAPEVIGNNQREVEYVDRARNCETAGDRICDTPADYYILTRSDTDCEYNQNYFDPDSILLNPDETNHMAYLYFHGCDDYIFTPQQIEVIEADIASRVSLNNIPLPDLEPVNEVASLISPVGDQQLDGFEDILLEWEPVENATKYMVHVSFNSQLIVITDRVLTDGTSVQISGLSEDRNYYWRVKAFNELDFCDNEFSEIESFRTGEQTTTSVFDIETLGDVTIYPNPIVDFSEVHIDYSNLKVAVKSISISNTSGMQLKHITDVNTSSKTLTVDDLQSGLYFVTINTDKGSLVKKIVVL